MSRKPWSLQDLELDKFDVNGSNETIVRVLDADVLTAVLNQGSGAASGSSDHFNGTATTTPINIPPVDGQTIVDILIEVPDDQDATNKLYVSLDGGILFKTLTTSANMVWSPRGNLKHVVIKGNSATVKYEIVMNREP